MKNNLFLILITLVIILPGCSRNIPQNISETGTLPVIFPADFGAVIPFNIAPLNFRVEGNCNQLFLSVKSNHGKFEQHFRGNKTSIPVKKWSQLLNASKGDSLFLTVYVHNGGKWLKYKPYVYYIAQEPIDEYLVYRLVMPGYQTWNHMGIYQRNLTGFSVETVLDSRLMPQTCMNCHSMAANNPDNMLLHLRENNGCTVIIRNNRVEKLNTKTPLTFSAVSFPYWHPSAKYIAFSVDKVRQLFPSHGQVRAHAFDMESDMVIYDIGKNEFFTSPLLFSKNAFEAFPCFSADGKTLYFVSAHAAPMPREFKNVRYSLCSIPFDAVNARLGETIDTLISAFRTGKSVALPRISPDGRHIMVTLVDHGNFPAYDTDADLYMYDTADSTLKRLDVLNSDNVESYHSWSSNGRWVVFSSRRMDGLYMNAYFTYVDKDGIPHKPFLLPQEDPDFHQTFLYSFNVPEFSIKRVTVNPYEIEKVAKKTKGEQVKFETTH